MIEGSFGGRFGREGGGEEESVDGRFLDEFRSVFGGVLEPGNRTALFLSIRTYWYPTSTSIGSNVDIENSHPNEQNPQLC